MSHENAALHRKVRALGRTRDQLESMVHSGPADAQELWEQLEKRWSDLENQAKLLTRGTEDLRDGVADMVRGNVTELRKGYERLASALREPRSESIWSQVRRISLGRLVPGGHRTSDCIAGSVLDLTDAAMVGMKKARIERTRSKKRAELGTRVQELAKEQTRFEEGPHAGSGRRPGEGPPAGPRVAGRRSGGRPVQVPRARPDRSMTLSGDVRGAGIVQGRIGGESGSPAGATIRLHQLPKPSR